MSSFPLTNSYFSRWLKPPTSKTIRIQIEKQGTYGNPGNKLKLVEEISTFLEKPSSLSVVYFFVEVQLEHLKSP